MVSVKKFWTIVIVLSLSLIITITTYADTYWVKGNKAKDKDGTEYLIFTDEHKVQLGFKVDGLNLVPIKDAKTDSIVKQKKIDEKIEKEKKKTANVQNFVSNLLKLFFTLIGMIVIVLIVFILCGIIRLLIGFNAIFKNS